ncbi:MAG TPA: DUF1559 domain-containing protein [Pirellulales bacterium]|jgi:hypothetical protein|nr:DUF1559 domain-containing protein [Pirellulales bacterium]
MRTILFIARYKRTFAAVLLVAALARSGQADQLSSAARSRAESRARLLAPFIDDQTIAVARVEISRIAVDKLFEFGKQFGLATDPLPQPAPAARQFVEGLKQAGAREVYVIASLADLPEQPPFFLVPLEEDSNEEQLKSALTVCEAQERIGGVLFAGRQKTRQRLLESSPKSRPELQRALEAAGDSQLQFVLMPSASVRRVVEELMPTLPASIGGGPTRNISRGAMWAAVTMNGPPEISARLVIQAQDTAAAATLRGLWRDMLTRAWPDGAKIGDTITPKLQNDQLVLQLEQASIQKISEFVGPALRTVTDLSRRQQSAEHLRQIGLAMHNYADVYGHFPPAASTARDGKPLLSWRVALLPYLSQAALYKEFHLDEPWDSEHNRRLIDRMPDVYRSSGSAAGENRTSYVVAVGKGSPFEGASGTAIHEITDGTSNTIMAVEIGDKQAVIWTSPEDYSYDIKQPSAGLTSPYPDGRLLLFCDGSAHFVTQALDDETLRRLLMRNDGQPVPQLR